MPPGRTVYRRLRLCRDGRPHHEHDAHGAHDHDIDDPAGHDDVDDARKLDDLHILNYSRIDDDHDHRAGAVDDHDHAAASVDDHHEHPAAVDQHVELDHLHDPAAHPDHDTAPRELLEAGAAHLHRELRLPGLSHRTGGAEGPQPDHGRHLLRGPR